MKRTFLSFFFLTFTCSVFAQPVDLDSLFSWKADILPSEISPGTTGSIELTLTVAPSHIVYKNMTSVSVETPEGIQSHEPIFPETHSKVDPIDGEKKEVFVDTSVFHIPFSLADSVAPGSLTLTVTAKYQGCSPTMCFFPQTRKFPLTVQVIAKGDTASGSTPESQPAAESSTTAATQSVQPPQDSRAGFIQETPSGADSSTTPIKLKDFSPSDDYFARGYFITFLLVYFFGILTSFTPCVYPLIPITVTIFGARKTKNTFQAFTLAFTYVMGIAVMYSTLGYIAASTGAVFGQVMSNPWVMSFIALFFVAMGLSMMGLFELQLPSAFQAKLSQVGGEGYGSAFFMGLIAGIIAAPCTGPILAGILAYVATTGSITLGISLLLVYSLGLGTLFLVIGTYSGMIQRLPKSGGWMEGVKSVFAVVLFVCALYFLKNAFPILILNHVRDWAIFLISLVLLVSGILNGAFHLSIHAKEKSARLRKLSGIFACVVACYLPLGTYTPVGKGQVQWITNLEEGLALAQEQKKPVMIDFWAEWCTVCKEIDHETFHDEGVANELNRRFVAIQIDLTRDNTKEAQAMIQQFKINGLPLIVFYDSQGRIQENLRINEFVPPAEFLPLLQGIR